MKLLTKELPMSPIKTFTPEVKHTADYAQFKFLPGNRPISERHVQELAESYAANPNLAELRPVLVNERMEMIDGQHRVRAAQKINMEVPYVIAPGLTVATAQLMNSLQKQWSLLDYARSYAYSGNKHYQDYERYLDDYGLTPSLTLAYLRGSLPGGKSTRLFKLGQFKMPEDLTAADKRFGMVSSFDDFNKIIPWHQDRFSKAFFKILDTEDYDHERMLRNLALAAPTVRPQSDVREWMRELERVYNYGVKSDIKRLF